MYKHCDNDEYISLHDCHATKIFYDKGTLSFIFNDGFWVLAEHPDNPFGKVICTDEGTVNFRLESGKEYDITIYIFEEKHGVTIRENWEISKLIDKINNEGCSLEFLYQYKGYNTLLFECWLWSDKKPHHRECQITISLTNAEYCWNNLCEDREW